LAPNPEVLHLHTYFFFPISIDQDAVMDEHPEIWRGSQPWFEKLDLWVTRHVVPGYESAAAQLGGWQRHSESSFDFNSPTYQDMMFFHPFVRRAFFDTGDTTTGHEALIHRYVIHPPAGTRLYYEAEDGAGESARVEVTDLRLLMFANGIGILTIGVEARNIPYAHALWINEMMRKIYPSSGHQIESGRIPNRLALVLETGAEQKHRTPSSTLLVRDVHSGPRAKLSEARAKWLRPAPHTTAIQHSQHARPSLVSLVSRTAPLTHATTTN